MTKKYHLLVLDLDGTLTNSKKEISPRNLQTLLRLQLVLASGRPTYGIAPLADALHMKEYGGFILSYNGGEIIEWSTGRLLYKNLLPDDVLPILYTASVRNEQAILTYDNEYILTESPDDEYVRTNRSRTLPPPAGTNQRLPFRALLPGAGADGNR